MRDNDIDNREAPRLWFMWEGLVALPSMGPAPKRRQLRHVDYPAILGHTVNTYAAKRLNDIVWRFDYRCNVVSFLYGDDLGWESELTEWLERYDIAATARAYSRPVFRSTVLVAPSCHRVYCGSSQMAATEFGNKGAYANPVSFDPLTN